MDAEAWQKLTGCDEIDGTEIREHQPIVGTEIVDGMLIGMASNLAREYVRKDELVIFAC